MFPSANNTNSTVVGLDNGNGNGNGNGNNRRRSKLTRPMVGSSRSVLSLQLPASFVLILLVLLSSSPSSSSSLTEAFAPLPTTATTTTTTIRSASSINKHQYQQKQQHQLGPLAMLSSIDIGDASLLLNWSSVAQSYDYLLQTCPLPTQAVTASLLAGVGDTLAQLQPHIRNVHNKRSLSLSLSSLQELQQRVDITRLQRFMLKGLGGGVIWAFWFGISDDLANSVLYHMNWFDFDFGMVGVDATVVDATVDATVDANVNKLGSASANIGRIVVSILLEQFLWVPLVYTFWDIPVPTLLATPDERKELPSIPDQVQSKLPQLLVDNAKVWTLVNVVVYNLPTQYRVLVSSLADIGWQAIMSQTVMNNDNVVIGGGGGSTTSPDLLLLEQDQEELILQGLLLGDEDSSITGATRRTGKVLP